MYRCIRDSEILPSSSWRGSNLQPVLREPKPGVVRQWNVCLLMHRDGIQKIIIIKSCSKICKKHDFMCLYKKHGSPHPQIKCVSISTLMSRQLCSVSCRGTWEYRWQNGHQIAMKAPQRQERDLKQSHSDGPDDRIWRRFSRKWHHITDGHKVVAGVSNARPVQLASLLNTLGSTNPMWRFVISFLSFFFF